MSDDLVKRYLDAKNGLSPGPFPILPGMDVRPRYVVHEHELDFLTARITALEAERTKVREVLASIDILSLPNDYPTEKMAEVRMETLNQRTLEGLALVGKVEILEAENKRLREALEPFAKEAIRLLPQNQFLPDFSTFPCAHFTQSDLRRAAAALEKK